MKSIHEAVLFVFVFSNLSGTSQSGGNSSKVFGFRNSSDEMAQEIRFMVVPDAKLAEEHLRILTQAPHMAGNAPRTRPPPTNVAQKFAKLALKPKLSNTTFS